MTKTWAKELGRKGINVNAVAPGFIATPMVEKMPEKIDEEIIDELDEFNVELEDVKEEFTMFRKQAKNWYAEMINQAMKSNKVDIQ